MSGPLRKVRAGISGVSDALNSPRMRRGVAQIGTGIRNAAGIAAIGLGALVTQVLAGLNSLVKLEKATAQTEAVVRSTGGVAGITAAKVGELSEKWESLNAQIGDESVRAGANMLLTFTKIRGKAFEPALEAVLNMNTAMGKGPEGLTTTAILVGKALNDPVKGMTALRRVGVSFTDQQIKTIKSLVKQNKLFEAQQIILAELDTEFGGSFIGQGNTTAGKVAKFTDSIEDLQRALATALLPTVGRIADKLSEFLANPKVIEGAEQLGEKIAGLFNDKNLAAGGRIFRDVFAAAKDAAPTIAAAAQITGKVVGTAVSMFRSLPPEIQKLAIGAFAINKLTGGLVTNIAGGLIGAVLKQLVSAVVNVQGAVVNVVGGVPGGGGLPGAPVAGLLGGAALGLGTIVTIAAIAPAAIALLALEITKGLPPPPGGVAPGRKGGGPGPGSTTRGAPQPVDVVKHSGDISQAERAADQEFQRAIKNAEIRTTGSTDRVQRTVAQQITAADLIRNAVDKSKAKIDEGLRHNASVVRDAVRNKKLSVTVNVDNRVSVSTRNVVNATARYRAIAQ